MERIASRRVGVRRQEVGPLKVTEEELLAWPLEDLHRRRVLIAGELNSGKTALTAKLLHRFIAGGIEPLVILDFAPFLEAFEDRLHHSFRGVGGPLSCPSGFEVFSEKGCRQGEWKGREGKDPWIAVDREARRSGLVSAKTVPRKIYARAALHAPRLEGCSREEIRLLAEINRRRIERMVDAVVKVRVSALFINDLTLYLHAGDLARFTRWLDMADGVVMNGYLGSRFDGMALSRRERELMGRLARGCDLVLCL